jgi:RHS repeat-associated protein
MRDLSLQALSATIALLSLAPHAIAQDADKPVAPAPHENVEVLDTLDVDPHSGGLVLNRTDLVVGEGEQTFRVTRNYRPWGGDVLNYGIHWASSLDLHLDISRDRSEASFQDADGHRVYFKRTKKGRLVSTTGAPAVVRELADGYSLRTEGRVYRFNAQGYVISRTGPTSHRVNYRYDTKNRLSRVEGPWGKVLLKRDARGVLRYIVNGGQRVALHRSTEGNLLRVARTVHNSFETYGYDGSGRMMWLASGKATISYDSDGQVVHLGGPGIYPLRARYAKGLDPWEREVRITRRGAEQIFRFSADRLRVQHVGPQGGTTTRVTDARGRLVSLTGPDGRTTRRSYDSKGRLATESTPLGSVRYRYGNKLVDRPTEILLADGRKISFRYDIRGNVLEMVAPGGATTRYGYDGAGRMNKLTDPRGSVSTFLHDENGQILRVEETGVGVTQFLRDEAGRLTKVKRPDGRVVSITHGLNGRTTRVSDALGVINEVEFDARRRPVRVRDEHGHDYRYLYSPRGDLLTITDHRQDHLAFVYDDHGQVTQIRDALGNTTTLERPDPSTLIVNDPTSGKRRIQTDALGRVVREERGGHTFRFDYDPKTGSLKTRHTPAGKDQFRYDDAGRIAAMEGPEGGFAFRYDDAGRLAELTNSKLGQSVSYTYDQANDRKSVRAPWGEVSYERNLQGHVTAMILPGDERVEIDVHPDGRRKEIRYANGVVTKFSYQKSRLKAVITTKGEAELDRRVYGYDTRGRVAWSEDHLKRRTSYTHDGQGRLTHAKGPEGEVAYRYDSNGNRTAEVRGDALTSFEVAAGNKIMSRKDAKGQVSYTYSSEGSLTSRKDSKGTTRYVYDHDQKLTEVEKADGTKVRYGYAPNGTRLWREDASGRNYFLHDLQNTIGELNVKGELLTSYVHGEGADDLLSAKRGDERFFYHYDSVRSVTSLTGKGGEVAARYGYDAFGGSTLSEGRAASWNSYRYTSRSLDSETGLYDYRARTYDAAQGRFTSSDPAGLFGGTNLYAYVGNAPLNYNDPYGLWPAWLDRKIESGKKWVNKNVVEPVSSAVSTAAKWTKENVIDPTVEAVSATVRNTVAFGRGFVGGVVGAVKGVAQMIMHPVQTGKALWHMVTHMDETKEMFKAKWAEYKDAWTNDPEKFWEMTGHLTAEVALAVVGPKGVTAAINMASKTATVARVASTTARVSRTIAAPVVRASTRAGAAMARTMPRTAKIVRSGRAMSRARNIELARRAAEGGNFFRRAGRRVKYVGKDVWNGARLAATRPGAFTVYSGARLGKGAAALIAANGRGAWKIVKNGTIPVHMAFEDNITDAIKAYKNREEALGDVRDKAKDFLRDSGKLTPTELAKRIEAIGETYGTYRDRLMSPVHDEDKALDAALTELDAKVESGEIPDNTLDSRLDAMLEEFGRRRHNTLVGIYDGNREDEHDMFNPSINRTISFQDEIDLLEAAKKKVSDPNSQALLDARIKDLTELMAYEYGLFQRGDHDVLIAGIAGVPRDESGTPYGAPEGSTAEGTEEREYQPGLLDSLDNLDSVDDR